MRKTQSEWDADERRYLATVAKAMKAGATPVGAAIIRPGMKGVVGVKARTPDPEIDQDPAK